MSIGPTQDGLEVPTTWFNAVENHVNNDRTINVITKGADPTGVIDSTTAFLTAVADAGARGTIYFPKGFYVIGNGLIQNLPFLTIRGEPGAVILVPSGKYGLRLEGCLFFTIESLTFQGAAGSRHAITIGAPVRDFVDGAMSSGSATLTSLLAEFEAGDVGKSVTVAGAGAAGATLAATINSITSPTQVVLSVAASTTVNNAAITINRTENGSHRGLIRNVLIPPSFDGDGIRWNEGILGTIEHPRMGQLATADLPSSDTAYRGGVFGANGSGAGIRVLNDGSGHNNGLTIIAPTIEAWSEQGLWADNMDNITVLGGVIEACGTKSTLNYASYPYNGNIYLRACHDSSILGTYMEPTGSSSINNLVVDGCRNTAFRNMPAGAVAAQRGTIRVTGECHRVRFENITGNDWTIGASAEDTTITDCLYAQASGTFADAGKRTKIHNLSTGSFSQEGGRGHASPVNLCTNGLFGRWQANGRPWEFNDVLGVSLTQTGLGQADTERDRGVFAMKSSTGGGGANANVPFDPTNGGTNLTVAKYGGQKMTVKVRVKKSAGTLIPGVSIWYDGGAVADNFQPASITTGVWTTFFCTFTVRTVHPSTGAPLTGFSIRLANNAGNVDDTMVVYWSGFECYVGEVAPLSPEFSGLPALQTTLDGQHVLTDAATINVYHEAAALQQVTLAGNRTVTLNNPVYGVPLRLLVIQDGTGTRTLTWPGGGAIRWAGGVAPILTVTGGKADLIELIPINIAAGTLVWLGRAIAQNY